VAQPTTPHRPRQMSDAALVADRVVPREPGRIERWGAVMSGNKLESVGIALALIAVFLVIFGPYLAPHDPYLVDFASSLKPPSWSHPFGTDEAGRDVLSRVLFGARTTLLSVAAVIAFATVVGVAVGTFAALSGGVVDEVLMRTADVGLSFPAL